MTMLLVRGFLTWLIPFIVSFLFFTPNGTPLIDITFFKSIMTVLGCLVGVLLLIQSFTKIKTNYLKESIRIGLIWFLMNIVLDLIFLLPLGKLTIMDYIIQIGIRDINIPIISIGMEYLTKNIQKEPSPHVLNPKSETK